MSGQLPSNAKKYKHVPLKRNEIRLLKLYPSTTPPVALPQEKSYNDTLVGELITLPINVEDEGPRENGLGDHSRSPTPASFASEDPSSGEPLISYEAVSYVWGGDDVDAERGRPFICIFLANSSGRQAGQKKQSYLTITPNLEAALKTFRSQMRTNEELHLWVDAICMNQDSDLEKSLQITMMADIYTQARCVRIWLGTDDANRRGEAAFTFMRKILTFDGVDALVQKPIAPDQWDAFRHLMQNSWFKRKWIVQEISFAGEANVYLGDNNIMKWDDMKGAISLFVDVSDRLRQMFQKATAYQNNPDYLGEIEAFGAKTLVDVTKRMFRKSSEGWIMEHLLSLEYLLTALTPFDAKLPHDSVYAIMRLSNDARPGANWKGTTRVFNDVPSALNHFSEACDHPTSPVAASIQVVDSTRPSQTKRQRNGSVKQSTTLTTVHVKGDTTSPPSSSYEASSKRPASPGEERGRPLKRRELVPGTVHLPKSRDPSPAAARREAEGEHRIPLRDFVVDYDKSMLSLCREVYNFIVERSSSIDIICKPWAPEIDSSDQDERIDDEDRKFKPSWIRPLSERPYGMRNPNERPYGIHNLNNQKYERLAAEPLVGMTLSGFKPYSASGMKPVPECFTPGEKYRGTLIEDRILNARGFVLDTIDDTASEALNATIPKDWPRFAGWKKKEELPRRFWTTLVANRRSSEGPEQPPDHWPHACIWAFSQRHKNGNLAINEILANFHEKPSEQVRPFLHRVRKVIWDRKLFWTGRLRHQSSRLGLAPREAKIGDKVCILYGCSVPVILRRKNRSRSRGRNNELRDAELKSRMRQPTGFRSRSRPPQTFPEISVSDFTTDTDGANPVEMAVAPASLPPPDLEQGNGNQSAPVSVAQIYTLIGECYVDGMMDGEAFHQKKHFELIEQDFKIGCREDCDCNVCQRGDFE